VCYSRHGTERKGSDSIRVDWVIDVDESPITGDFDPRCAYSQVLDAHATLHARRCLRWKSVLSVVLQMKDGVHLRRWRRWGLWRWRGLGWRRWCGLWPWCGLRWRCCCCCCRWPFGDLLLSEPELNHWAFGILAPRSTPMRLTSRCALSAGCPWCRLAAAGEAARGDLRTARGDDRDAGGGGGNWWRRCDVTTGAPVAGFFGDRCRRGGGVGPITRVPTPPTTAGVVRPPAVIAGTAAFQRHTHHANNC